LIPTLEKDEGVQRFDKCEGVNQSNNRSLILTGREWFIVVIVT